MTRARVPLSEYVTEYSVRNKADEDIPVYSVTNSQGFCTEYFGKEVASKDKTTYKIVPRGYFAYNPSRINVGSIDWQRHEDRVIVSPLYNVFAVSDKMDKQYLYYFLRSDIGRQMIRAKAAGSVRDNLKIEMLKEMTVPDMTVDEQRRCAAVLDRLHGLIVLRQQQLASLDTLIKARFVEMFGEPETNPMQWNVVPLKQLMTVEPQNGLYKPQSDYVQDGSGTPILRIDAFYDGRVTDFSLLKRLICSDTEKQRYLLCENDIVINRVNSIEYLGKCAHITGMAEDTVFESNMMRFHLDEKVINAEFATHLLCSKYIYNQILRRAKKAVNQASINQGDVQSFVMLVPPLELQNQFAAFVAQVDKSKAVVQAAHVIARNLHSRRKQKCRILNF